MNIYIYDSAKAIHGAEIHIETYLEHIRSGKWAGAIASLRAIRGEAEQKEYKSTKIPAGMFAGTCPEKRNDANVMMPTGIIYADVDRSLPNGLITRLRNDEHVLFMYQSCRATGYHVGFRFQTDSIEDHINNWLIIKNYMFIKHNITIDEKAKNISRLAFVSHDPNLYYDPFAKYFDSFEFLDSIKTKPRPINTELKRNPIKEFNEAHPVTEILERNGFIKTAKGRYKDPNQKSNAGGIVVFGDKIHCFTTSSMLYSEHNQDAFDLYCKLECGNDHKQALGWNEDINKANREHPHESDFDSVDTKTHNVPEGFWERLRFNNNALSLKPEPQEFFIKNLMPKRGVLLTGLGGSSKSRLMLLTAIAGVIGRFPWDDWEVDHTGSSIVVMTEDTAKDVHNDMYHILNDLNLSIEERDLIRERLHIFPIAGQPAIFLELKNNVLTESAIFKSFKTYLSKIENISFIAIDPALGVTHGDELSQSHNRALGGLIDSLAVQFKCCAMLISHSSKGTLGQSELQSHSSRGAGAISDVVRGEFSVRNMTVTEAQAFKILDVEDRKRYFQFVCTKANRLGPSAFIPTWFRRDDYGNPQIARELIATGIQLTPGESEALTVLKTMQATSSDGVKRADWVNELITRGMNLSRRQFDRIIERLVKANSVKKKSFGVFELV